MVLVSFWHYPDPDPYRLKRIRPNDTDPDPKLSFKWWTLVNVKQQYLTFSLMFIVQHLQVIWNILNRLEHMEFLNTWNTLEHLEHFEELSVKSENENFFWLNHTN